MQKIFINMTPQSNGFGDKVKSKNNKVQFEYYCCHYEKFVFSDVALPTRVHKIIVL